MTVFLVLKHKSAVWAAAEIIAALAIHAKTVPAALCHPHMLTSYRKRKRKGESIPPWRTSLLTAKLGEVVPCQ